MYFMILRFLFITCCYVRFFMPSFSSEKNVWLQSNLLNQILVQVKGFGLLFLCCFDYRLNSKYIYLLCAEGMMQPKHVTCSYMSQLQITEENGAHFCFIIFLRSVQIHYNSLTLLHLLLDYTLQQTIAQKSTCRFTIILY